MRLRRRVVGWVTAVVAVAAPDPAAALSCFRPPIHDVVMTGGGVVEATVAALRPFAPLLFDALEWFGLPVANRPDQFELALEDVQPLWGPAPATIRTSLAHLQPGRRYVFVASRRPIGPPIVSACAGWVIEASRAAELKAWLASLSQLPAGGRLFGMVHGVWSGGTPEAGGPGGGVRVVARGPVVVEALADGSGQFGLAGLPDGRYDVRAVSVDRGGRRRVSRPVTEWLVGDHAAAWVDLFASHDLPAADPPVRPVLR